MSIPAITPIDEITRDQLDELNTQYNGNLRSMTEYDRSSWKSQLIAEGYTWNDLDGWGYWSVPSGLAKRLRRVVATTPTVPIPILPKLEKKRVFRRPNMVSSIARNDMFDPLPPIVRPRTINPRRSTRVHFIDDLY